MVLSGKGGTGKTLIATNLALLMKAIYVDADVEEPNGFIFLKPKLNNVRQIEVEIPKIDSLKCQPCYKCVSFCEFNALAIAKKKILVFNKLCHSCGGCKIVCQYGALTYKKKKIGIIEEGQTGHLKCLRGVLEVGEAISSFLIKELLANLNDDLHIIDGAPGTSCNVLNTLRYADYAILVTEPTEFGIHDLKRALKLVENFKIPFGVVINKVFEEDNLIKRYCQHNKIKILGNLKYDKGIAKLYSKGLLLINDKKYKSIFNDLRNQLKEHLLCK